MCLRLFVEYREINRHRIKKTSICCRVTHGFGIVQARKNLEQQTQIIVGINSIKVAKKLPLQFKPLSEILILRGGLYIKCGSAGLTHMFCVK